MIEIKNLSVTYQRDRPVLQDINLQSKDGSMTGIIGPNGAGKSTLLKAILQLIPFSGKILIDQQAAHKQLKNIAYVEQRSLIDFNFPITVKECVALGRYPHLGLFSRLKAEDWRKVSQAMNALAIDHLANRSIGAVSGGQFQRVLIARCLVQEAPYLFLDEPFIGIDQTSEQKIMEVLRKLSQQGKTIFIVHHNLANAEAYFDHIILLNKQLIAYGPSAQVLNSTNLNRAYGLSLMKEMTS
ncbi:metal ABC transporter ATP-binding protein [Ignavigranum ruoffiae]|uniref:metal ABC transporter ATP-binding protein n=1 Tax=Ignavigranum ruoffiae TaxID=89093 RepID=UPI0024ACC6DC|nr:metal ABC transporter ATP-binding protein [Ignavigranum ruoffiae]